ncbi:putative quinol monooxygenase [Cognatiyoonia sp. IB215182]|uniref:putative quinol monooxygenase n=1 Tax=Cognatiyoonia sp. IB215182 TaxID=3097353 RepID=UPI002A16C5BA|nr:antibiotic biosynthesis monooxygenase [Cognatiyoonia sp. IB215182]MDX8355030.1 antibiotic biosynthesis monooxygenase [Cognatiyoonia sp. IB215182]
MTVEYIRYEIPLTERTAFVAAYAEAKVPSMASPYATSFDICQCDEDPGHFILRIEWTSAEDHMQKFRGSAAFRTFFDHIKPYVGNITEMRHYTRIDQG